MAHNRYYIVNATDPNLPQIEAVIVGLPTTQRYSVDGTQIVVKLHEGDHHNYTFLADYQEENHEQILISMNTPEWAPEIPIE
jgi:hypothetical protein